MLVERCHSIKTQSIHRHSNCSFAANKTYKLFNISISHSHHVLWILNCEWIFIKKKHHDHTDQYSEWAVRVTPFLRGGRNKIERNEINITKLINSHFNLCVNELKMSSKTNNECVSSPVADYYAINRKLFRFQLQHTSSMTHNAGLIPLSPVGRGDTWLINLYMILVSVL
jgi:hypothetical protein